jgi:hypothetical protein
MGDMTGDPTQSATELLIDEFRQRFPLLEKIVGEFGDEGPRERIPWFFGFLLAAANNPNPGGCCFVLDISAGTTAIAALLAALSRLKADFPRLVEDYARHEFTPGQRVRVLPSDAVFEYEGIWSEFPGQFKLKLIGAETRSFRSFPLVDILRLEPTDRLRPQGTGATNLGQRASGPLDKLLDFNSCGNNSIIRNVVLCHMPRAQFTRTIDAITLAPTHAKTFERLSQFVSWGSIDPDGLLRANDSHQTVGEPLVAVSGFPEDIARNCRASPANTKVIFADGPQRFARDLQAYDDIVEKQRLILLASPTDIDDIQTLRDRGCVIWRMAPGEILLGESSPRTRSRRSLVGRTVRAGDVRQRTAVTAIACEDEKIEAIARALEGASASLDENDQTVELDDGLARLFGVLFECSECCFGAPDTAIESIESVRSVISRNARWLRSDISANLAEAIDGLRSLVKDKSDHSKAGALVNLLGDRMLDKGESWAVLGRSSRTAACLVQGLKNYGLAPVVTAISSMTFESEYDGIVLAGWPNDPRFRRLLELAAAPEVIVLTYHFEKKWYERYRIKARQRDCSDILTADQRAQIVQVPPSRFNGQQYHSPFAGPEQPAVAEPEAPVFQFEARIARRHASFSIPLPDSSHDLRPTHLVRFAGGCHAFLTEWAELSVLNDVIEHGESEGAKIGRKTVAKFVPGDFLLFRAAGDKEFIRLIAEEMMGSEEYSRQRKMAERWKTALHALGTSPAVVQRRLADFGLDRTSVTVGNWLVDPDKIGPGTDADIEVIARAAGDKELLASLQLVINAISTIRSAHLSAGMHLTKLILSELRGRIRDIRDEPTLLDLGYGGAWVVQVESVEAEPINWPANKTNRLLWDAETGY